VSRDVEVLGSTQRREGHTFVLLSADLIDGEHRYLTNDPDVMWTFETAEVAKDWAPDGQRALIMQVPMRTVVNKAMAEGKHIKAVSASGEVHTGTFTPDQ
jgi:hypothetical protein